MLLATVLGLLVTLGVGVQPALAAAQQSSSHVVGNNTVTYGPEWLIDTEISDNTGVFLLHDTLSGVVFIYTEYAEDPSLSTDEAIELGADEFVTALGDSTSNVVGQGQLSPNLNWHLHALDQGGIPFGMLLVGDVTSEPGVAKITLILAPAGSMNDAATAVQSAIDYSGAGSPLNGLDTTQLDATLAGEVPQNTGSSEQSGGLALPPLGNATEPATEATQESGGLTLPPLGGATEPSSEPTQSSGGLNLPPLGGATEPATESTQATGGQTPPQGQTVTVAGLTVSYSGAWVYDEATSSPDEMVFFYLDPSPLGVFGYGVMPTDPGAGNAGTMLTEFNVGFYESLGATDLQEVGLQEVSDTVAWSLHTGGLFDMQVYVLVYATVDSATGEFRVTALMEEVSIFESTLADASQSFSVDGQPILPELDPATVTAMLSGGQATTPDAPTTPPQTGSGNGMTVAGASLQFGDSWTFAEDISSPDETIFLTLDTASLVFYAFVSSQDPNGAEALISLQEYDEGFFSTFGAEGVQTVTSEALPSGNAYSIHTGTLNGVDVVVLTYADITSQPGVFRVEMVIGAAQEFDLGFAAAQESIQVDDGVAFSELDAATVSGLLGGSTPSDAPAQTGSTVDVVQLQSQDAATGCDGIGWVATSPDQIPATEQDVDYRAACFGGVTYFAACGWIEGNQFFSPEEGMSWIRCDVLARIDGEPTEVSFIDFSIIDSAGGQHGFDLAGMASLSGAPEFPEGPVATGETVSGAIVFSVPASTAAPMVLRIAPIGQVAAGGETGTLVISEPLPDFTAFGF